MPVPRDAAFCPVFHHAVELIGKRWTGVILCAILAGCTRYADICDTVPGLSDTMLSERLRELETEGIVTRAVSARPPIRVDYRLTSKGEALHHAIEAISLWAEDWADQPAARVPNSTQERAGESSATKPRHVTASP